MKEREEETDYYDGFSRPRREARGGRAGRLSLLGRTVTFRPGSEQHFLI